MAVFGIFKTSKEDGAVPEFVGQASDPTPSKALVIARKVTGGESATAMNVFDGEVGSVVTHGNYVDFVEKEYCLDLIQRSKR